MSEAKASDLTTRGLTPSVRIAALFHLGLAVALGLIRFFGERQPVHDAEWWLADVAVAAVVAAPAVLALSASRSPALLLAAGLSSVGTSILFVSLAGLPLIIPGVLYLIGYSRGDNQARTRSAAVVVVVPVVTIGAALLVLFTQHQVVCWQSMRYRDGHTVSSRDHAAERASSSGSFTQRSGPPRADVIAEEGGCTDGAIRPVGSVAMLSLVIVGLGGARIAADRGVR